MFFIIVSLAVLCRAQYIEIRCIFNNPSEYGCGAGEFVITFNATFTIAFVGNHLPGRSNIDVVQITMQHPPLPFFVKEVFTTFPNLRRMHLQGTNLNILGDSFQNARNLENFEISGSNVVLSDFALTGAGNMTVMQIADCQTLIIDEFAFAGLQSLDTLLIFRSSLHQLPENIFFSLVNLERFNLHQGFVETLPANLFANNHLLRSITIISNPINEIGRSFINHLGRLESLILADGRCVGNEWFNVRESWVEIHTVLQPCYRNYEERPRHFSMELRGSLTIFDRRGDVVVRL